MMRRIFFLSLPGLLLFYACNHKSGNRASVSGKFSDAAGFSMVLQEMDTKGVRSVDSVVFDQSGKFTFNPVIPETGFWILKAPSGKILVLVLNADDQIQLSGSTSDFPNQVVMRAPSDAMLLNGFFRTTRQRERIADSLETLLIDRQDSAGYYELTQKIDLYFKNILKAQRSDEIAYINKYMSSLTSLVVLNYAFGMNPVLSPEEDLNYYAKVDSALFRILPENKHVKFHHQRVLELKQRFSLKRQ